MGGFDGVCRVSRRGYGGKFGQGLGVYRVVGTVVRHVDGTHGREGGGSLADELRCGRVGRGDQFRYGVGGVAIGVAVQAGVDHGGEGEEGRVDVGGDERAYAVVDEVVRGGVVAGGIAVVDEEVSAEHHRSVMGVVGVGIVGGADADNEVGGIGGNDRREHFVFLQGAGGVDTGCHQVFDAADNDYYC